MKIKHFIVVASVFLLGACSNLSMIPGVFSHDFSKTPNQVFSGNFVKDGSVNNYKLVLIPNSASSVIDDRSKLVYTAQFSVQGSDYHLRVESQAFVKANVIYDEGRDVYVVSGFELERPIEFSGLDPFFTVNIWPGVEQSLKSELKKSQDIIIETK